MQELRLKFPLNDLLELTGLKRSTFFYHIQKRDDKYAELKQSISNIFYENKGRYGYRRIHLALKAEGIHKNSKLVRRLMRELGLAGLTNAKQRKYSSYRGKIGKIADNHFRRDFHADRPYQKWATDVTEFKTKEGKLYLSPVVDLFNMEIVSYEISPRPTFALVKNMINKALNVLPDGAHPVVHSDQGWQYQMPEYQQILFEKGATQSMSRKGNCLDNAVAECFFSVLKREMYFGHEQEFITNEQLEIAISEYIHYYNNNRIKLRLQGFSPVKYRELYQDQ